MRCFTVYCCQEFGVASSSWLHNYLYHIGQFRSAVELTSTYFFSNILKDGCALDFKFSTFYVIIFEIRT